MENKISEIVKTGLEHSIAQAFLIFSGILIIVSVKYHAKSYILLISFLTLFYAFIAHYLTAMRKHGSLGRYAVGNNLGQMILFTLIFILYFLWWTTSVGAILLSCTRLASSLLYISIGILILAALLTIVWFIHMFSNKKKVEKNLKGNYKLQLICKHCGFGEKNKIRIPIPKKRPIWDHPCPRCGLYELERATDKPTYKIAVTCENCGQSFGEVEIPYGLPFKDFPCPNCKVTALKK